MGTTAEDKYTNYPPGMKKDNEELEAFFEEQRKAKEKAEAQPTPEPTPEPKPEPVVEPEPQPEPEPEPSPEMVSKADLDKAEQRYRVLQNKYDKEVPELYRQVRFLYDQNQKLQIEKPKVEAKPKVSFRESPKIQALKAELAPEVFENLIGAMEETAEGQKRVFEEETEKLRGEFSTTRVKDRDEIFWDTIYGSHEDYDGIRDNSKFQEFLSEQEGLSGLTRGDFFINAYNKRDSKTYIRYLNAFKKGNEGVPPPDPNKKLVEGEPNPDKLKSKIGAPRSTGGPSITSTTTKTMTKEQALAEQNRANAEYEKISNEFNRGLWEGREKEYDKKEAELQGIILRTNKILEGG